jgi:hypothetical protein
MHILRCAPLLAAVATLGACGHHMHPSINLLHGKVHVADGRLEINAGAGEADVSADGQLTIGGQPVAVTPGQRAQLVAYYRAAAAVMDHALATGVAGAKVGAAAAGAVTDGILKGDMSGVKDKVRTQADAVRRDALLICADLSAMRSAQETLNAGLPAFQPYAIVSPGDVTLCTTGLKETPKA